MKNVFTLLAAALLVAGLSACEDPTTGGTLTPTPKDTTQDDGGDKPPDVTGDGDAGACEVDPPAESVVVSILGIAELEGWAKPLCASELTVLAGVSNAGGYVPRLFMEVGGSQVLLPEEAVASSVAGRWEFKVDFSRYLAKDPPDEEQTTVIADGDQVKLIVGLVDPCDDTPSLPSKTEWTGSQTRTFDLTPPTITLTEPDLNIEPITMSGVSPIRGKIEDAIQVGGVGATFEGTDLGTTAAPSEGVSTSWNFEADVDMRDESGNGTLVVRGLDACGNAAEEPVDVLAIKWPRLRSFERYTVEGSNLTIRDTLAADWNGDGYDDIFVATNRGVALLLNDGEESKDNADGKGRFKNQTFLTSNSAYQVAVMDADRNGSVDLAVIDQVGAKRRLSIFTQGDDWRKLTHLELYVIDALPQGAEVVDLIARDFSGGVFDNDDALPHQDLLVVTDSNDLTLMLYRRQQPPADDGLGLCGPVDAEPPEPDPDADASGDTTEACETRYAPTPLLAGGVGEARHVAVGDFTSPSGDVGGDGYLDVVVGAFKTNALSAFVNRLGVSPGADAAFTSAIGSDVWPQPGTDGADAKYFCLADFVEDGQLDAVAGTENYTTWRVLIGDGKGAFHNRKQTPEDTLDPMNMSGIHGPGVQGVICADFNGDTHMDFAVVSQQSRIMQFQMGDGQGRFNQVDGNPMANPINEGIGFTIGGLQNRPRTGDFNGDGLPDVMLDDNKEEIRVFINTTSDEYGFDMNATRALMTPLSKRQANSGGRLVAMAIGDVVGDADPEIIGLRRAGNQPRDIWLSTYHPMGADYRMWIDGGKEKQGALIYVWGKGQYGTIPSFPAAYDHLDPKAYGGETGAISADSVRVIDLVGPGGSEGPDGANDIVVSGNAIGTPQSRVGIFQNSGNDYWDPSLLSPLSGNAIGTMFSPFPGVFSGVQRIYDIALVRPVATMQMPAIIVGTQKFPDELIGIESTARMCTWGPGPDDTPSVWSCEQFFDVDSQIGQIIGPDVRDIEQIAIQGENAGEPTDDPNVAHDLIMVSNAADDYAYFDWGDPQSSFPYTFRGRYKLGTGPVDIALRDMDGDGDVDMSAVIQNDVVVGWNDSSAQPFTSPLPVDKRCAVQGLSSEQCDFEQNGARNVVMTDINWDGYLDVVFTQPNVGNLRVYLNIGEQEGTGQAWRLFHGPIDIDVCQGASKLILHTLEPTKSRCEDILVMCEDAGAIAMLRNESAGCAIAP